MTTHLLNIERVVWPKLHAMFKARDAKAWQREFTVGFLVAICASNLLLINIFLDIVTCIESGYVIKAFLVCQFVRFFAGKTALVMKGSCNFSRKKSNELTDIPDMFYYRTSMLLGNHKRQRRPCSWSNITNLQQKTTPWRHQMETFSALLTLCAGNSPVTGEFSAQRPITRSFDVFFDLRLNKRLGKQSWGWWFETPSRSLWRHCNAYCCK